MQMGTKMKPLSRRHLLTLLACTPVAGSMAIRTHQVGQMASLDIDRPGLSDSVTMFLAGDVMLGRGIDQILPHPGNPHLYESGTASAATYLELAEAAHGPIPRPVDFSYVWGDALPALQSVRPEARIINLETSVTKSAQPDPKGINYKMNPENIGCLSALNVNCCILANNHVMDWGRAGLLETMETLERAQIATVGAGRDATGARTPAILKAGNGRNIVIFAFGSSTSGIPSAWAAMAGRPGVNFLNELSDRAIADIAERARPFRLAGNILIASIHWGGNWGYAVPDEQRYFAQQLIDKAGFDVVHGHSAHHAKAIEVYRGRPILYGCGDFINDYEGISGYETFRDDLTIMYLIRFSASAGRLIELKLIPFQIRRFQLNRASRNDGAWLRETLDRESAKFGTRIVSKEDDSFYATW